MSQYKKRDKKAGDKKSPFKPVGTVNFMAPSDVPKQKSGGKDFENKRDPRESNGKDDKNGGDFKKNKF